MPRGNKSTPRRRPALPPTPATSSPTQEEKKARTQSLSKEQEAGAEPLSEIVVARAEIARIITFIETINTQQQNLVLRNPTDTTLWVFSAAVTPDRHSDLTTSNDNCRALASLLSRSLPRETLRYRYILHPHRLIIRPMPTPAHDASHRFTCSYLCNPQLSPLLKILTPAQLGFIQVDVGGGVEAPGGPVDRGYENVLEQRFPGVFPRTKPRAVAKQPDVAFTYDSSLAPSAPSDFGDDKEEEGKIAPTPLATIAFPDVVFETGYTESYQNLLADCADYLVSSKGQIKLAVLIHIDYQRQPPRSSSPSPSASDSDNNNGSRPATPASPPSDADDYRRAALTAGDPDTVATSALSKPFTVFVECWTYNPASDAATTTSTTNSGPTPYPILLRAPGRVYLLKEGVQQGNPGIFMCPADFGLDNGDAGMKYISFRYMVTLLMAARTKMVYNEIVRTGKDRRAKRKCAGGDVGDSYVGGPDHGVNAGKSKESAQEEDASDGESRVKRARKVAPASSVQTRKMARDLNLR